MMDKELKRELEENFNGKLSDPEVKKLFKDLYDITQLIYANLKRLQPEIKDGTIIDLSPKHRETIEKEIEALELQSKEICTKIAEKTGLLPESVDFLKFEVFGYYGFYEK